MATTDTPQTTPAQTMADVMKLVDALIDLHRNVFTTGDGKGAYTNEQWQARFAIQNAVTALAATQERAAPLEGARMPYCNVKKLNQESYSIELEGMATAEVSVMSEDAQEMVLAHIAEWMLTAPESPQPLAPPPGWTKERGYHALVQVVYELQNDGSYSDDEGEETQALVDLVLRMEEADAAPQPPASALPLAVWPPTHLEDGTENPAWLTFKHGTLNPALEAANGSALPLAVGVETWKCSRCGASSAQACSEVGCFLGENGPQPVAWIVHTKEGDLIVDYPAERYGSTNPRTPLYAALPPPGRGMVPMTDMEIAGLRQAHGITSDGRGIKEFTKVVSFVRAIEAAHGIKEGS